MVPLVNPFCLQNLFHVTDVFLPPDNVANLQKVTEPTLILTVVAALYSCYLLPSPRPTVNATHPSVPFLWIPAVTVLLPTSLHALQSSLQQYSWGAGQESEKETQVCQSGVRPAPAQFTGRITSQQASDMMP